MREGGHVAGLFIFLLWRFCEDTRFFWIDVHIRDNRRYLVAQGHEAGWVVDGKSYARWADGHYAEDHWESVGDDVPEDYDPFADGEDE